MLAATLLILLAGGFWGSMGLFVRRLNTLGFSFGLWVLIGAIVCLVPHSSHLASKRLSPPLTEYHCEP